MMLFRQHRAQAAQFVAWNDKRGGEWVDNFYVWASSKDFDMADYIAIKTLVMEYLTSRGVAPVELDGVA